MSLACIECTFETMLKLQRKTAAFYQPTRCLHQSPRFPASCVGIAHAQKRDSRKMKRLRSPCQQQHYPSGATSETRVGESNWSHVMCEWREVLSWECRPDTTWKRSGNCAQISPNVHETRKLNAYSWQRSPIEEAEQRLFDVELRDGLLSATSFASRYRCSAVTRILWTTVRLFLKPLASSVH